MRDRLWSVQEGGQDDVGEVPADTREMITLKNGDFCIFPQYAVHGIFEDMRSSRICRVVKGGAEADWRFGSDRSAYLGLT